MWNSRDIEIKTDICKKESENMPTLKFYSALKLVVSTSHSRIVTMKLRTHACLQKT